MVIFLPSTILIYLILPYTVPDSPPSLYRKPLTKKFL
nr:hypothetical protein [Jeotgalibacillus soli]